MIKSVTSVKLTNRRVLLRAGFDTPLKKNIHSEEWEVSDDARIVAGLSTINYLIQQRSRVVIVSKLGRPNGWEKDLSMWPVALKLGEFLNMKVVKVADRLPEYPVAHIYFLSHDITKGDYAHLTKAMREGDILFLENMRFYPQEEANDPGFVELLAGFGDVYVDDAFSMAHRKEASTFGLASKLPSFAGIGFMNEITQLRKVFRPKKPMVVLVGGAKISDKIEALENLASSADYILVGGAVANTFLKVSGYEVGKSKIADEHLAKELMRNYKDRIILPIDVVVAKTADGKATAVNVDKIKPNDFIFDIGPETIRKFASIIKLAKTLVWNGPFGFFENPKYSFGSRALASVFAQVSKGSAYGVVGGGETVELFGAAKVSEFIDHVSMGGGAMLEFLSGKQLPGIKALETN